MTCRTHRGRRRRIVLAVAAGVGLAAGHGSAEAPGAAQAEPAPVGPAGQLVAHMTSVTGTIARVGDGGAGQPHPIGIVSAERRIYLVGDEGVGRQLKHLVGKTVTVAAVVKQDVDGWPYLAVEWFRVLEG